MKTQHEILMQDSEFRRLLALEDLVADASELIAKLMDERKVSKAGLARRLNKSRAWVTQLLNGKANMTIRTLAEVAHALEAEVKLHARPPIWKNAGKPPTVRRPIVFDMDNYVLDSPTVEQVFRLENNVSESTENELELERADDELTRPQYAA